MLDSLSLQGFNDAGVKLSHGVFLLPALIVVKMLVLSKVLAYLFVKAKIVI